MSDISYFQKLLNDWERAKGRRERFETFMANGGRFNLRLAVDGDVYMTTELNTFWTEGYREAILKSCLNKSIELENAAREALLSAATTESFAPVIARAAREVQTPTRAGTEASR